MPAQKPGQSHPPGTATNKRLNTAEKDQTPKYVPRGIEDDDVPYASVPTQAVVRLENGKLIIRQRVYYFEPVSEKRGNETVSSYQLRSAVSGTTIPDIADINVFDMKGNRLMPKTWKERLKVDVHTPRSDPSWHQGIRTLSYWANGPTARTGLDENT
jgi:hypothetical protein